MAIIKALTVEAKAENLDLVTDFVDDFLEENDCPMKTQMQVNIAIDEVFHNIVSYAYTDKNGDIEIQIDSDGPVKLVLIFKDKGVKFDPLQNTDPDITLSSDEREVGGLGIFMVKKLMDVVTYSYEDGTNILTLEKTWQKSF